MTLRQLIEKGANLDDEIWAQILVYDSNDKYQGTIYSYGIDYNETDAEDGIITIVTKAKPI